MESKKIEIKKDEVAVCTAKYLAEKLGVSERHVRELRAKGVLCTTRTKSGMRYDIVNSLIGLAEYNNAKKKDEASGSILGGQIPTVDEMRNRLAAIGIEGVDGDILRIVYFTALLTSIDPEQLQEMLR